MPTINKLPLLGTPSSGDQIPVYAPNSGDARRMSITALTDYMQDTLDLPDNSDEVSFLQSGTGAATRTVQSKLRDVVSVKDFGAVGDGVTDDSAAIQSAISASSRIFFPPGTYAIASPIRILTQKQIIGSGMGTVIKALPALASASIPAITPSTYSPVLAKVPMLYNSTAIQWWSITGIQLDGNSQDVYGLWLCENYYGCIKDVYILNTTNRPYTNIRGQAVEHLDFVCYGCGQGVVAYDNTNLVFIGGGFERLAGDWYFDQRQPSVFSKGGVRFQDVWFESDATKTPTDGFLRMSGRRNRADIHASFHTTATVEKSLSLNDSTSSRTVDGITMGANPCIGGQFTVNNVTGGMFIEAKAGAAYNAIDGWFTVANVTDNGTANDWDVNPSLATPVQQVSNRFQVRYPLSISATGYVLDADYASGAPVIRLLGNNNNKIDLNSGKLRLTSNLGQDYVTTSGGYSWTIGGTGAYTFTGSSGATGYTKPLYLGAYALWVDSAGALRIKNGAPTSDTDGTVVGTQT